ncbi:MAG: hypothetical protein QF473_23450, partial [Planctomycetota bacterium]|nr:hypothetical protein [Planctomycetota bacterium]
EAAEGDVGRCKLCPAVVPVAFALWMDWRPGREIRQVFAVSIRLAFVAANAVLVEDRLDLSPEAEASHRPVPGGDFRRFFG